MIGRGLPSTLRTDFRSDIQLLDSGFVRFWAAAGLLVALLLPLALSNFWTGVANQVFIAVVGALALNLLMGTTGQISLGHAGFVAAGAFTVAVLITHVDAPIGVTLPAAAIVGAILGVLVGLPALRLKGLYLAVSTLAAHFVIIVGVGQYQSAISYGAGFTIPPPAFFGFAIGSERAWYFFLLPFALGVMLLNLNWLRSAYGRAWMAIRHRDIAAESLGINVALYKLLAFSASTSLTCVAGALWAYHTGFVSVEAFDFDMLIQFLAMVIIGGLGSVLGACFGAVFVVVLPHIISIAADQVAVLAGAGRQEFRPSGRRVRRRHAAVPHSGAARPRRHLGARAVLLPALAVQVSGVGVLTMLEVENLEVVYNRVIVAVQGVSLKVPENSIVALLGTNGAGKSTTVRAISGFLPVDDADIRKGAIRFGGQSILGSAALRHRRGAASCWCRSGARFSRR